MTQGPVTSLRSRSARRLSLSGAILWFALSYGVAVLGYVGVNAIASRLLGQADFGYFVIATTLSTVIGQLGLMGVHRGGLREAARLSPDDHDSLLLLRRGVRAVNVVSLPLISTITGLVTAALFQGTGAVKLVAGLGMALLVLLGGQQKLWANFLRGFGEVRFASVLEGRSGGALVAISQGVLLLALYILAPHSGLSGALAASAIGFAIPVLVARRRVVSKWAHLPKGGRLTDDLRLVLKRDWRFASNQVGSYLNATVEVWLAGLILTGVGTSNFSAAQRLSLLVIIPLTSLQVVFAPVTSRLVSSGDLPALERLLRTGATVAAGVTAVMWVPMLILPGRMLELVFGDRFGEAAPILVLLTVGNIANVLSGLCGTLLTMSHHEGVVATVQWLAVGVRIVFGVIAVSIGGVLGLGISAATVTVVLFTTMWFTAHRRIGLWTHPTVHLDLRGLRNARG